MIYDSLSNLSCYRAMIPSFELVEDFLKGDLSSLADGRYEIDGNNLYASIDSYSVKPFSRAAVKRSDSYPSLFESHDRYIDIQIAFVGAELCGIYPDASALEVVTPYDAERDIRFLEWGEGFSLLSLRPGRFAVFYPQDAHMPCLADKELYALKGDELGKVRKCVIKIKVGA